MLLRQSLEFAVLHRIKIDRQALFGSHRTLPQYAARCSRIRALLCMVNNYFPYRCRDVWGRGGRTRISATRVAATPQCPMRGSPFPCAPPIRVQGRGCRGRRERRDRLRCLDHRDCRVIAATPALLAVPGTGTAAMVVFLLIPIGRRAATVVVLARHRTVEAVAVRLRGRRVRVHPGGDRFEIGQRRVGSSSASRASSSARRTPLRCTARVFANASMDDNSRFCKPATASAPAACRDRLSPARRLSVRGGRHRASRRARARAHPAPGRRGRSASPCASESRLRARGRRT